MIEEINPADRIAGIIDHAEVLGVDPPAATRAPAARKRSRKVPNSGTSAAPGDDDRELADGSRPPSDGRWTGGFEPEEMNRRFAVVLVGSKAVIAEEADSGPVEDRLRFIALDAFHTLFENKFTKVVNAKGEEKYITWSRAWMKWPKRRTLQGVEFFPDPENESGRRDHLNLWRGFSVTPDRSVKERGGYWTFEDHLRNNVCGGDKDLFRWVFGWFAHIVQRPRERVGTALVLRGGQGAGKTIVGLTFGSLIKAHYYLVDSPRYVTGQFNSHLASCLLLQADEGFWAGDKTAEGTLKGLVTSQFQMVEHKGVDPIRIANYVRLMVSSNEDWVIPAGKDERRFAVLDIDPRCSQDHTYFREMEFELEHGGREALLADLLDFDLDSVDLRRIPKTEALLEQKLRSFDPVESWWYERLRAGFTIEEGTWSQTVVVRDLHDDYIRMADRIGVKRRSEETAFGMKLKRLIPTIERRREYAKDRNGALVRSWVYKFPSLTNCRAAMSKLLGQDIAWDPEEIEPNAHPERDEDFVVE